MCIVHYLLVIMVVLNCTTLFMKSICPYGHHISGLTNSSRSKSKMGNEDHTQFHSLDNSLNHSLENSLNHSLDRRQVLNASFRSRKDKMWCKINSGKSDIRFIISIFSTIMFLSMLINFRPFDSVSFYQIFQKENIIKTKYNGTSFSKKLIVYLKQRFQNCYFYINYNYKRLVNSSRIS